MIRLGEPTIIREQLRPRTAGDIAMAPPKTKIALFSPTMCGGGAQRVMLNLACGLASRGDMDVDLVLAKKAGELLAEIPSSVNLVDLQASRTATSVIGLTRYLRRVRPHGMISAQDYGNIIALWARKLAGVPTRIVITEHTILSRHNDKSTKLRNRVTAALVRRCYRWADVISAVSNGVADDIAQFADIPRNQIRTIYNPIIRRELNEFMRADVDDPWFQAGGVPVILAVGRLGRVKDYPTLIRAFARLRETRAARLVILGEGGERSRLEALIRELKLEDCVKMPGYVSNPFAYMARASLFALTSLREGLSNVLVEALYCGCPVVATDCPVGPREVLRDGEYGRLVPVGDDAALAQAMLQSLDSKPPADVCSDRYEVQSVVDQYAETLLKK